MKLNTVFKKFLSVILAFTILNANIFAFDFDIEKEIAQIRADISQTIKPLTDADIRLKYRKEYNFKALFDNINRQGFANNYGQVCDGDICAPYNIFMRGLIGALIDFSEGDGRILINYTNEIRDAAFLGALSSKDITPLQKLLKEGSKEVLKDCDGANYQAQDNCQKGLAGLSILAVVWEDQTQAESNADFIYKTLNKHKKSTYSNLVLLEGISALSFMDTDYSYDLIERFLTVDSAPSRIGNKTRQALDMLSLQGLYDAGEKEIEERYNNATKYLNRFNERWQYLDTAKTKQAGIDADIFASQDALAGRFDDNYLKTAYHAVYNNTLTDIGEFLAAQGKRGQKLAKKIVRKYASATPAERETMHTPLILGLIQNLELGYALTAAGQINKSFYYDINGGTGALIATKSAIKGSGLSKHVQNTVSEKYFLTKAKIGRVNFIGDMFIGTVSIGYLAASIPNMVSNIYRLATLRSLKFNFSAAQKSSKIKALPKAEPVTVKPQIAPARQPQIMPAKPTPQITQPVPLKAINAPKAPAVKSLGNHALSKIRGKVKAQQNIVPDLPAKPAPGVLTPVAISGNTPAGHAVASAPNLIDVNSAYAYRKSVFRLAGFDNSFSGYLAEVPLLGAKKQVIITAGHGVSRFPNKPVTIFSHLGKKITDADVLLYRYNNDITNHVIEDFALLIPREKIDATPVNISFTGLDDYKNVATFSFPEKQFLYSIKTPISLISRDNFKYISYNNIGFLGGGAVGGESGGLVVAEISPNQYGAVGTIIANYDNRATLVHNLGWLRDFLQGELRISNVINPKMAIVPAKQGTQLELPFEPVSMYDFPPAAPAYNAADLVDASILSHVAAGELISVHDMMVGARAVWRLKDIKGKIIAYLKYGTEDEIVRTKSFHEIVSKIDFNQYPLIKLEYPRIMVEKEIPLPYHLKDNISKELSRIKYSLWGNGRRGQVPFVMTPINSEGFLYYDIFNSNGREEIMKKLNGQIITLQEWKQLEELFLEINRMGFVHEDLNNNMFLRRNEEGTLVIGLLDFEPGPYRMASNSADLIQIGKRFEMHGIIESTNPALNFRFKYK